MTSNATADGLVNSEFAFLKARFSVESRHSFVQKLEAKLCKDQFYFYILVSDIGYSIIRRCLIELLQPHGLDCTSIHNAHVGLLYSMVSKCSFSSRLCRRIFP